MKITDSPAAMVVIPLKATDVAKAFESSSIFQPVMSTVLELVFVTSNQSARTELLPLDQGATSEMISGEGASFKSFTAKVKVVVASVVLPTVVSSTLTLML